MTVIDILTRVDTICKKYDVDKQRESNISGDNAFARLYGAFETQIETALEKAEIVTKEKNRASAVAMNAEIRRIKARLAEEVPKLQRLALKRVVDLGVEVLFDHGLKFDMFD
ncbi:hypothetical protein IGI04_007809 [Brassica rapa subsp. trilocularis]|uniref:Syntaxin N-terminal domain-containing protein n=1 Tax=Brassica rapa subsp. trilocularis TaxID=1813537 RepID=A0ABQ7NN43_BRACM|nr:hypothetical protein IGI04_007809 [Brassica rapa subsp. trilocularis]